MHWHRNGFLRLSGSKNKRARGENAAHNIRRGDVPVLLDAPVHGHDLRCVAGALNSPGEFGGAALPFGVRNGLPGTGRQLQAKIVVGDGAGRPACAAHRASYRSAAQGDLEALIQLCQLVLAHAHLKGLVVRAAYRKSQCGRAGQDKVTAVCATVVYQPPVHGGELVDVATAVHLVGEGGVLRVRAVPAGALVFRECLGQICEDEIYFCVFVHRRCAGRAGLAVRAIGKRRASAGIGQHQLHHFVDFLNGIACHIQSYRGSTVIGREADRARRASAIAAQAVATTGEIVGCDARIGRHAPVHGGGLIQIALAGHGVSQGFVTVVGRAARAGVRAFREAAFVYRD